MIQPIDVARYFLSLSDPDAGDHLSNLKLQKLLYYAQGATLALSGKPLFDEPIEAWQHGPVVKSVYHQYKKSGAGAVTDDQPLDYSIFESETREILDEVYDVYGQFSAWKLRNMTYEETPWKDTPVGGEITHDKLKEFFSTRISAS